MCVYIHIVYIYMCIYVYIYVYSLYPILSDLILSHLILSIHDTYIPNNNIYIYTEIQCPYIHIQGTVYSPVN